MGQPIPADLSYPPPMIFELCLAMDFVIAVNRFNIYKWEFFTKERYCQVGYKNPFFEIHRVSDGVQHNPAGLPYPPAQDFGAVTDYR